MLSGRKNFNPAEFAKLLLKAPWLIFCLAIFVTNSFIPPDDQLTKISAMDTSIYLGIAEAFPGIPPPGTNYVYHSACRFLLPYLIGGVSKLIDIPAWNGIQFSVAIITLLSAWCFWRLAGFLTNQYATRLIFTAIFVFHTYLMRLQLAFSGFIGDAAFVLSLIITLTALLRINLRSLIYALALMFIVKQTAYLVIPVCILWTFFEPKWRIVPRYSLAFTWVIFLISAIIYRIATHFVVRDFSTPESTIQMAFGLIHWFMESPFQSALREFVPFAGRGVLALLCPLLIFAVIFKQIIPNFKGERLDFLFLMLFLACTAQPVLSGPSITDASILRLGSYGVVPLCAYSMYLLQRYDLRISDFKIKSMVLLLFLASFHHLFSVLGPNLNLRYLFITIHTICISLFAYAFKQSIELSEKNARRISYPG